MKMLTLIQIEEMLFTIGPVLIFKLWMAEPAAILVAAMLIAPKPPLLSQLRITAGAVVI